MFIIDIQLPKICEQAHQVRRKWSELYTYCFQKVEMSTKMYENRKTKVKISTRENIN